MILINTSNNSIISENVEIADSYFKRLIGLMCTQELSVNNALHIIPCSSIHTFFMNYSIDVIYLDMNNRIIHIDEGIEPKKIGRWFKNARSVVELPNGKVKNSQIMVGQVVAFLDRVI